MVGEGHPMPGCSKQVFTSMSGNCSEVKEVQEKAQPGRVQLLKQVTQNYIKQQLITHAKYSGSSGWKKCNI